MSPACGWEGKAGVRTLYNYMHRFDRRGWGGEELTPLPRPTPGPKEKDSINRDYYFHWRQKRICWAKRFINSCGEDTPAGACGCAGVGASVLQVMIHGWSAPNPNYGKANKMGLKDTAAEVHKTLALSRLCDWSIYAGAVSPLGLKGLCRFGKVHPPPAPGPGGPWSPKWL